MFDTKQEITDQLKVGEDSRAEFKEIRMGNPSVISPNAHDLAGELVAFANTQGGAAFLGVDDGGIVKGIPAEQLKDVEQWAINIATQNCDPPIRPSVRRVALVGPDDDERTILLLEVERGLFVHRTGKGRYYIRVGSTKRDATPTELARLFQDRGRAFVFDEQLVPGATADDLDEKSVDAFFRSSGSIPRIDLLRNTRVLTPDEDGTDRPTVAGLLAFGAKPQEHMRSSFIDAAVYRGDEVDSDVLVHAERIDGRVDQQIDAVMAFVERFMLKPATKTTGRQDYPQYDLGAIHEAIVNSVAHRDYSLDGAKIRLFLLADRLELYSPGALPNTLSIETMPFRVFTRNQLLVTFLARMVSARTGRAFLESRGEGVRRILNVSEAHSGRRPEYELFGKELRLTVWAKPSPHADGTR